MKKLVALIALICIAFACVVGCGTGNVQSPAVTGTAAPNASADAAAADVPTLDYDRLRALCDENEVVLSVNGYDVTWGKYYDWLYMNAKQIEDHFAQMQAYYGTASDWAGSIGDGSGTTFAQYPVKYTDDTLIEYGAIRTLAESRGVSLSEESLAMLDEDTLAAAVCGEGATAADLEAALADIYMTLDSYKELAELNYLYSDIVEQWYGKDGANLSDEEIAAYFEEQGYVSAHHILIMTVDTTTGEALDEAAAAEKKALAESLYAELAAIEDKAERLARFEELKAEHCEDVGGAATYPHGYTYPKGTMVTEFEDAAASLDMYDISEPVQSSYGYHIIMRLPVTGDSLIYSSASAPQTAGTILAKNFFNDELSASKKAAEIVRAPILETLDLLDYVK